MLELARLNVGDAGRLEAFLVQHRDTSMFLRANARRAGLVYEGHRFQGVYVGGFRAGVLVGVASHTWSGMLLLQAPEAIDEIVRACVDASRRPVSGITGPAAQVRAARSALGLDGVPAMLEEDEALYVLDLPRWQVPDLLRGGAITCRAPLPSERDTLIRWRIGYEIEILARPDTEAVRKQAEGWIDSYIADAVAWVAVVGGAPVSMAMFNATLPDIVQLGGVYTPPEQRVRGYARAVVAHAVLTGKQRGAERAVLFTQNPSAARSYEAVGFRRAGDYGLLHFG